MLISVSVPYMVAFTPLPKPLCHGGSFLGSASEAAAVLVASSSACVQLQHVEVFVMQILDVQKNGNKGISLTKCPCTSTCGLWVVAFVVPSTTP